MGIEIIKEALLESALKLQDTLTIGLVNILSSWLWLVHIEMVWNNPRGFVDWRTILRWKLKKYVMNWMELIEIRDHYRALLKLDIETSGYISY